MCIRQQQQEMLQQAAKHVEKTNEEIVRVQVENHQFIVEKVKVKCVQEAADKEEETTPGRRARRSAATAAKLAMSYQVLPLLPLKQAPPFQAL